MKLTSQALELKAGHVANGPLEPLAPYTHLAYKSAVHWSGDDIEIEADDLGTDDPVVTARITTPAGILDVMAEPSQKGRCLVLERLHMHGVDIGPRQFGLANLRALAQAVMERMDLDEIVIRGAVRTSGANPRRRPGERRFTRKT